MIRFPFAHRAHAAMYAPRQYWKSVPREIHSTSIEDAAFFARVACRSVRLSFRRSFLLEFFQGTSYTILKLGQWISTRRDLFSKDVCDTLAKLRDSAPGYNPDHAQRRAAALGAALREPIGSGSVAQVYRACMGGRRVAVKILHPDIRIKIGKELSTIGKLVKLLSRLELLRPYDIESQFLEFKRGFLAQCDLRNEAANLKVLRMLNKGVHVPRPLFSDVGVLVESFVDTQEFPGRADRELALRFLDFFFPMVIRHRLIHADLHSGNIKKTPEGAIALLDAGICKYLSTNEQKNLHDLAYALFFGDNGRDAARLLLDRLPKNRHVNRPLFVADFEALCRKHLYRSLDAAGGPRRFLGLFPMFSSYRPRHCVFSPDFENVRTIIGAFHDVFKKHMVVLDSAYSHLLASIACLDGSARPCYKHLDSGDAYRAFLRHASVSDVLWRDTASRLSRLFREQ